MTLARPHSPPRARSARLATSADAAAAAIRAHGLRLSAARRLVLEAIYTAEGPVKAEEIAGGLDGRLPRSDLASVYRNLETLERLGLVRHVHLGHGPGRYERVGPHRDYLVCERCHTIASLPRDQLQAARRTIAEVTGFAVRFDHFPLTGLCPGCSDSAADYAP
jgi:Fur family transcriptional regulator, ferric uptake regulator